MADSVPAWLWQIHPARANGAYLIEVVVGAEEVDPENFNADVQVIRGGEPVWSATFYTLANLSWLFEKNTATGECGGGMFFKDSHMVIVRRFDRETIEATVAALEENGGFD